MWKAMLKGHWSQQCKLQKKGTCIILDCITIIYQKILYIVVDNNTVLFKALTLQVCGIVAGGGSWTLPVAAMDHMSELRQVACCNLMWVCVSVCVLLKIPFCVTCHVLFFAVSCVSAPIFCFHTNCVHYCYLQGKRLQCWELLPILPRHCRWQTRYFTGQNFRVDFKIGSIPMKHFLVIR